MTKCNDYLRIDNKGKIYRNKRPRTIGWTIYETIAISIVNPRAVANIVGK